MIKRREPNFGLYKLRIAWRSHDVNNRWMPGQTTAPKKKPEWSGWKTEGGLCLTCKEFAFLRKIRQRMEKVMGWASISLWTANSNKSSKSLVRVRLSACVQVNMNNYSFYLWVHVWCKRNDHLNPENWNGKLRRASIKASAWKTRHRFDSGSFSRLWKCRALTGFLSYIS